LKLANKVSLEKLQTGLPGLDTLLDGGISKYAFVVLTGAPGSGKTTLAHQIMFALANPQRRALFFTVMGEPPLKMLRYQQQYSFFDPAKVGTSVKYLNLAEDLKKGGFDGVLERILNEVENFQPELIFVDSFKSVVHATMDDPHNAANLQYFVQTLGIQLATWQATTFLLGEYADAVQQENPIFTVADGVIHLSQNLDQNALVRKIQVVKMRGTYHMSGLHTFRITDDGLHIFPRLLTGSSVNGTDRLAVASPLNRLSTGCDKLDAMLGGGIPQGYSVVAAGPPGCGKTVLATAFLAAGVKAGEHGIVASFEQFMSASPNASLQELIASGGVTAVRPMSLDLSIEEFVTVLGDAVNRTGAKRLVIDSLSSLKLVLAPQFKANFLESLFRMLSTLHMRGVTVLMLRNTMDMSSQVLSPSSFMVDGVISMRYVEINHKLVKLISIPKLRGSFHSDELRIYKLHEHGIDIAEAT
jgi:circadian clock protein KaiC